MSTAEKGATEISRGPLQTFLDLGIVLHRQGRLNEAKSTYEQALNEDENCADAMHLLGLVCFDLGEQEKGLVLVQAAVERRPSVANFHRNLGSMLEARDALSDALSAYREAFRLDPSFAAALFCCGNVLKRMRRFPEAVEAYEASIALHSHEEVHHQLGIALACLGRFEDGLAAIDQALAIRVDYPQAQASRGEVLYRLGDHEQAVVAFECAIAGDPQGWDARLGRAHALRLQGRTDEALKAYDLVIAARPTLSAAHFGRGRVLQGTRRFDDAITAYRKVLDLEPAHAEASNNMGNVLRSMFRLGEALSAYDHALSIRPDFAEAHNNKGNALLDLGETEQALAAYERALECRPTFAMAHFNKGNVLQAQFDSNAALSAYRDALQCDPEYVEARNSLGVVLRDLGRVHEALEAFDRALDVVPDHAAALTNRANLLMDLGQFHKAALDYERALRLAPHLLETHSNYLSCLNYDPTRSDAELFDAHRHYGEKHAKRSALAMAHGNDRDLRRPLRIGFVSADLGRHPVGYLVQPLMESADPNALRIHCYSGRILEDDLSDRLRSRAVVWRRTQGLSDTELAAAIETDGIDILIDLSGHTAGNRLGCFAHRPAPIQVHWCGYANTTGSFAIDYALWDDVHVPAGAEVWFTERVVRLPLRWCYAPPAYAPDVVAPPCTGNGHVTFGSFNNLTKLVAEVVETWSQILHSVSRSRLMLSWNTLTDSGEQARIRKLFFERGIASERIALSQGADTHAGVLAQYGRVDIALDPFPYSGGLTTLEALWMGVPVLTVPASRPVSRQTASLLTALGRGEWIAGDRAAYVQLALDLAADPAQLTAWRRDQRARMAGSPLCDGPRFARAFEQALRAMWQTWCYPTSSSSG